MPIAAAALIAAASVGCADKKPSAPPMITLGVEFPSTAAAVLTENLSVYVFDGSATSCLTLITDEQTGMQQSFPPTLYQDTTLTPCLLASNPPVLPIGPSTEYTVLVVGEAGGHDQTIGCAVYDAFGESIPQPVSLTFINDRQSLGSTSCTSFSTFCMGGCK
jgi:hypothetical protein